MIQLIILNILFDSYKDCDFASQENQRYSYDSHPCEYSRETIEAWEDAKDRMRIIAIVLLVICLLFLLAAMVLGILMCYQCSKGTQGKTYRVNRRKIYSQFIPAGLQI